MPEDVNRETVERRRDRLLDEYGDARVHEEREVVAADEFPELRRLSRDGYTGGGYAWVVREPHEAATLSESMPDEVDEGRAVLMIRTRGGDRWGHPGGGREAGGTYEEAAVREVREETGVDCELTDLFLLRHRVTVSAGDHDERLHTLWVFFDARYTAGHIDIQPGELDGAAWFDSAPTRLRPENAYRAASFGTASRTTVIRWPIGASEATVSFAATVSSMSEEWLYWKRFTTRLCRRISPRSTTNWPRC